MATDAFFRRHGGFVLFTLLVLMGGLYVACTGSVDEANEEPPAADASDDGPRSNNKK